jgi:hypothetical protein
MLQRFWPIFKMALVVLAILLSLAPQLGLAQTDITTASTTASAPAATHSINVGAVCVMKVRTRSLQ